MMQISHPDPTSGPSELLAPGREANLYSPTVTRYRAMQLRKLIALCRANPMTTQRGCIAAHAGEYSWLIHDKGHCSRYIRQRCIIAIMFL